VGTSGGVWGLERGYCMMVGAETDVVSHLDPIFGMLAPGAGNIARTPGRENSTAPRNWRTGYLHCGNNGAGHFVKMVHNGIEYGIMAAYAEGQCHCVRYIRPGVPKREAWTVFTRAWICPAGEGGRRDLPQFSRPLGNTADDLRARKRFIAAVSLTQRHMGVNA
jgi:hypothetical protein